ncbi:MAG: hypothetical protein QM756_13650 [Polyangiaceae bacterium]
MALSRFALCFSLLALACSSNVGASKSQKSCDDACQAQVAARGLRETLKLAYNLTLNGKPVGAQDASHACLGGSVRVHGEAYSNAEQGSTDVDLVYSFDACGYRQVSATQNQNYDLVLRGDVRESGVLTVQPTAPTALIITSDALDIEGSVFDPPIDFQRLGCAVSLAQSGNRLSGTMCGQAVGLSL